MIRLRDEKKLMRYFNLNIKHYENPAQYRPNEKRVSHATKWLDVSGAAPIFYEMNSLAEIRVGNMLGSAKAKAEASQFVEIGSHPKEFENITIVTIDEGYVWIYRPKGEILENPVDGYPRDLPKFFPVEILAKRPVKDVPFILASMRVNQAFSRGTFVQIKEEAGYGLGNIAAIEAVLKQEKKANRPEVEADPLDCLSSVELETLIAKIFENNGFFVPAYRGGVLADIDLIVHNRTSLEIDLDGLRVEPAQSKTIQIKLQTNKPGKDKGQANYLITASSLKSGAACFGREWLYEQINKVQSVKDWLDESLSWLKC